MNRMRLIAEDIQSNRVTRILMVKDLKHTLRVLRYGATEHGNVVPCICFGPCVYVEARCGGMAFDSVEASEQKKIILRRFICRK